MSARVRPSMSHKFQAAWRNSSTAPYVWFLDSKAPCAGARILAGAAAATSARSLAAGAGCAGENHVLWRAELARPVVPAILALLGFLLGCGGLGVGLLAAYTNSCSAVMRAALWCAAADNAALPLVMAPITQLPLYTNRRWDCRLSAPRAVTAFPQLRSLFVLTGCLASDPIIGGAAQYPAVAHSGLAPWVCFSATPATARVASVAALGSTHGWGAFSARCAERALAARTLSSAWQRHVTARRAAGSAWTSSWPSQAAQPLEAPAAQLKQLRAAYTLLTPVGHRVQPYAAALVTSRLSLSSATVQPAARLRYVQAPLVWAHRRLSLEA